MTVQMTYTKYGEATVSLAFDLAPFGNVLNAAALQRVGEMLASGRVYTEAGLADQNASQVGYKTTDIGGGNSSIAFTLARPIGVYGGASASASIASMPTASITLP
jgi:hypothetical protein